MYVLETDSRNRLGRGWWIGRYACREDVQRRRSVGVSSIDIGAMCQKRFDDAEFEVPDRAMKRGLPEASRELTRDAFFASSLLTRLTFPKR